MSRKYKIRPQFISGIETSFDWISDVEIDDLLGIREGTPISISEAALRFYEACIKNDCSIDLAILSLGLIGFAKMNRYKIDLRKDLEVIDSLVVQ